MFRAGFGYKPDFIVIFSERFVCAYFVCDNHICAFFGKFCGHCRLRHLFQRQTQSQLGFPSCVQALPRYRGFGELDS